MAVTRAARRLVLARAPDSCEYCRIRGWPLTVDHVIPRPQLSEAQPGVNADHPDNLAAACALCNRGKSDATTGRDPRTRTEQPLFNPRLHTWDTHFRWSASYQDIVGISPIGRATVRRLRLNRAGYRVQRRLLRAATRGGAPPWP